MPMLEIGLGLLCAVAGGGAGWMGRGKLEARMRNDAALAAATSAAKSARRVAGGKKAAETRKAAKSATPKQEQPATDMGLVQRQQFNGAAAGAAGEGHMYGRGNGAALHGGE